MQRGFSGRCAQEEEDARPLWGGYGTVRGQAYTLVGPSALLPFCLRSYLSLRSCLSWMQIYAAKSER